MSESVKKHGVLALIVKGNVEIRGKVHVENETFVATYVENNVSQSDVLELSQIAYIGRQAKGDSNQIDLTLKNGATFTIKSLPEQQDTAEWNQLGDFLLSSHSK
ncbi:MAG: hypothetical protein ACRCWQ_07000 [Bacilli bacterium]